MLTAEQLESIKAIDGAFKDVPKRLSAEQLKEQKEILEHIAQGKSQHDPDDDLLDDTTRQNILAMRELARHRLNT